MKESVTRWSYVEAKSYPSHIMTGHFTGLAYRLKDEGKHELASKANELSNAYSLAAMSGSKDARKKADELLKKHRPHLGAYYKEAVTTLPGSLGVNPPQWTTAHHNVPPEWLDQEGHPCMIGGHHGTMQIVNGRLICVVNSKESTVMPDVVEAKAADLSDLPIHQQLAHAVTRYDIKQQSAAQKNPKRYYNPHALGLYMGAAERAHEDIKRGKSVADAINTHFNGSLADHMHRTLKTGGMSRDKALRKSLESTEMSDVVTEATTLRFSSPSRVQIAKAQVYWDIHRRQKGLGVVKVGPIEGTDGNWYFDVSSHSDNQFLTTSRMNNILPGNVTVTSGGPVVTQQNASQNNNDTARNTIREMVEKKLQELKEELGVSYS